MHEFISDCGRCALRRDQGERKVIINYNKLWHLMLDKKMNKTDLKRATGISTASIAKLGKGENITTDILVKICESLGCELSEIMELEHKEVGDKPSRR